MMIKNLKDFDFQNKRVLVRCDLNVPLKEGEILDDYRIRMVLPTIKYLYERGAKILLLSHLGRPNGKVDETLSLSPIGKKISELMGTKVKLIKNYIGDSGKKEEILNMNGSEIFLLENVQFYSGEKENNSDFAKELASYADIFIMEAFGQVHREYASIIGISKYIQSGIGLLLEKELDILKSLESPELPYVAIIGGSKIETKTALIKKMIKKADYLLLGGKVANSVLKKKGIIEEYFKNEEVEKAVKEIDLDNPKIHLPTDGIIYSKDNQEVSIRKAEKGVVKINEDFFDIGPLTILEFSNIIKEAKTIVINGPLGFFEDERFEDGTKKILEEIVKNKKALKIAGGGETASAIFKYGFENGFSHISTGGGSLLEALSGKVLPGIEALYE